MNLSNTTETLDRTAAAIRVHAHDNVAVALRPIGAGEKIEVAGRTICVREAIERGHKFALDDLGANDIVRKYGWPIGRATKPIDAGAHVHEHNVVTL
ncbi:MAG: UxaA family hydrolase, partial [Sphingomonas sp.]|nr:UxaA family hydrolase [Sphingomonas sp.]